MPFTFEHLAIPEVVRVVPKFFGDARGFFEETYRQDLFREAGITVSFLQDNHSFSHKGVLRGLHWQAAPYAQGKLVSVVLGAIWDVAVDVRKGSPTYGKWVASELSDQNHAMLWIPEGFAHGFTVLSDTAHFLYKCTNVYHPASERSCRWDDPELAIEWPVKGDPCLSPKDLVAPPFRAIEPFSVK